MCRRRCPGRRTGAAVAGFCGKHPLHVALASIPISSPAQQPGQASCRVIPQYPPLPRLCCLNLCDTSFFVTGARPISSSSRAAAAPGNPAGLSTHHHLLAPLFPFSLLPTRIITAPSPVRAKSAPQNVGLRELGLPPRGLRPEVDNCASSSIDPRQAQCPLPVHRQKVGPHRALQR